MSLENRTQKRGETGAQLLPTKSKRVRGSSNSVLCTHITSMNETQDTDMRASSSSSGSSQAEEEGWRGSVYTSDYICRILHEYPTQASSDDHDKLMQISSFLEESTDPAAQLASLNELCEVLSLTAPSLSNRIISTLSPVLVRLAKQEDSDDPEIMLLAIRAMTYACDVFPRAPGFLVRDGAVSALCHRLEAIEYVDVAEQCFKALEKLSRDHPVACLQAGAIMAVLRFIEFFSPRAQRAALSVVGFICSRKPVECPLPFIEAAPILCNLLQGENRQVVENVVCCLTKIVELASHSPEMLDALCQQGLITGITNLMRRESGAILSNTTHNGLISLLVKLSSGSAMAVRTLHELEISSILKAILASCNLSHGIYSPMLDGSNNQVLEILNLLNNLLLHAMPPYQDAQNVIDKELFMVDHPYFLHKFGLDLLPMLIKMVNSGGSVDVCYGSLSVIKKLICVSKSDSTMELLNNANLLSCLAGAYSWEDQHVLFLCLEISEMILRKHSAMVTSFMKEGALFGIDTLLLSLPHQWRKEEASSKCLCYLFETSGPGGRCGIEEDDVRNLARCIRTTYFPPESYGSGKGSTGIFQRLKAVSDALMNVPGNADSFCKNGTEFLSMVLEFTDLLLGAEPVSAFEFVGSGIVKSMANSLSTAHHLLGEVAETRHCRCEKCCFTEERFEAFARVFFCDSNPVGDLPVSVLVRKLQHTLSSLENFPVVLSFAHRKKNYFSAIPHRRCTSYPCLKVRFVRGEGGEPHLKDCSEAAISVDPLSSMDEIGGALLPKVGVKEKELDASRCSSNFIEAVILGPGKTGETSSSAEYTIEEDVVMVDTRKKKILVPNTSCDTSPKLAFYLEGREVEGSSTLYQAILQQNMESNNKDNSGTRLWAQVHTLTYKRKGAKIGEESSDGSSLPSETEDLCLPEKVGAYARKSIFFSALLNHGLASNSACSDRFKSSSDVLFLLKSLEFANRVAFHAISRERIRAFAEGLTDSLDDLKVAVHSLSQRDFVNGKLTEKLEQQLQDPFAAYPGGIPFWCNWLMNSFPFLFSFETRCKYFRLSAFPPQKGRFASRSPRTSSPSFPQKFVVSRDRVFESTSKMMDLYADVKVPIEVAYEEEIGTGLGPTLEFFTLISQEYQKSGLGLWRAEADYGAPSAAKCSGLDDSAAVVTRFGLFPRPWSHASCTSGGVPFSQVIAKFTLLGQLVAKSLQDGRLLDLPFSKAFYKIILQQELNLHDIDSFDPELHGTLLQFQALASRKKFQELNSSSLPVPDLCIRRSRIEDLCLDFTLPGYPDYALVSDPVPETVSMRNLEEYVALVVDATTGAGIRRQVEAFKSGFNQVFPIERLRVFNEAELEHLLCGERDFCAFNDVADHVKLDHGYTSTSPPIINFMEIIKELSYEQRRAFLKFITGSPRLPLGGLASLNPKLTIVQKSCIVDADAELPSVMTCANYLKLPPYSSKKKMEEKLLYAISEGQASFHLS